MIYTTTARASALASANQHNLPFVAWDNVGATATLGGSTPVTGGERENAVTGSTYDKFRAAGDASDEVTLSFSGLSSQVSFAAICAHNLATVGGAVIVQSQGASRTNLLLRSEQFDNAVWQKTATASVTPNFVEAPNGQMTADLFTSSGLGPYVYQNVTPAGGLANKTFTFSVWLWTTEAANKLGVLYIYGTAGLEVIAQTIITLTTTPTRYTVTTTFPASPVSTGVQSRIDWFGESGKSHSIFAWGAQLEQSAAATSYIPTTTAAVASAWYDMTNWGIPEDNSPIAFRFNATSLSVTSVRFLFIGVSSAETLAIGSAFIGQELIVPQGFYQGFSPVITPTEVQLQSNVSVGNELLGSSVIGRGSTLQASFTHLTPAFIRGADWKAFQRHFNDGGGFYFGWRPSDYPQDIHYCWRNGAPIRPTNSGPKDYMGADFAAQVHNAF